MFERKTQAANDEDSEDRKITRMSAPRKDGIGRASKKNKAQVNSIAQADELEAVKKALRGEESFLLSTLDILPVPIVLYSQADGMILYANAAFADLTGESLSAIIGRKEAEFYTNPLNHRRVAQALKRDGALREHEVRLKKPSGAIVWAALSATTIVFEGRPCVLNCYHDITVRKRLEDGLKQFRALMDQSNDAIFLLDPATGRYVDFDQSALEWLGYTRKELMEKEIFDISKSIVTLADWKERMEQVSKGSGLIYETEYKRKDATLFPVEVSARMVEYNGKSTLLKIVRDITERRQAQTLQTAVYQIGEAADKAADLNELFRAVHSIVERTMPAQNFYIALYDEASNLLSFPYYVDEMEGMISLPPAHPERGMTGYVLRTGKSLLSDAKNFEELMRQKEVELVGVPSPIWIGAPLVVEGKTIGVIALQDYHDPNAYTERELHILEFVSGQVARAIERARLHEDIRHRNRILIALQKAILPLLEQTELSEVLQEILKQAIELLRAEEGFVYLLKADESELVLSMRGGTSARRIDSRLRKGEGLAGKAWEAGEPVIVNEYMSWDGRSSQFEGAGLHAAAAVPLKAKLKIMGVLGVGYKTPEREFSQSDLELLTRFSELAALAIENAILYTQNSQELAERKYAEEALQEAEEKYRQLIEQLPVVVYVNPIDEVEKTTYVSPQIMDFLGYSQEEWLAQPFLWRQTLHPADSDAILNEVGRMQQFQLPFDQEYRMIARDGRIVWIRDRTILARDLNGQPAFWQGLMIDITDKKEAEEQINLQLKRLNALRTIDMFIASGAELRFTLQAILRQAVEYLKADAADILLLNQPMNVLEFAEGVGFRSRGLGRTTLRVGESFAGRIAARREAINVEDIREYEKHPLFLLEGFIGYYGVPLITKGEVKGVLEVFKRSKLESSSEWVNFLETLAGQAALAIDSAALFESFQRANVDLTLAYESTIEGWSAALDLRDKEPEGRTQRITELTLKIADAMGVNEKELIHIRRGALLHDIGKMGIPDRILLKTGELTDEEREAMRQHPVYSYNLLSKIEYLRPAIDIPYYHHERWDGSGYPVGLQGEAIPLAARIFAVVDVWDALRSDRLHRPARSKEYALDYIKSLAGVAFDPNVVKVFLRVIDEE